MRKTLLDIDINFISFVQYVLNLNFHEKGDFLLFIITGERSVSRFNYSWDSSSSSSADFDRRKWAQMGGFKGCSKNFRVLVRNDEKTSKKIKIKMCERILRKRWRPTNSETYFLWLNCYVKFNINLTYSIQMHLCKR